MKNIFQKSHSADSGVKTRIDLIAMKNSTALALLLTLLGLLSNPLRLEAADVYWKGGQEGNPPGNGLWDGPNGTWTDIGGITPVAMPGSTDRVVFSALGVGAVNSTLGQDFTIERLGKISSLNALIGGDNTLTIHQSTPDAPAIFSNYGAFFTITAPVVFAGSADEILVGGNSTVRIASLAGANNFTKNGTGLLEFTGNNSYSGSTTVQSGTLLVNGPGGLYGGNQSLWTGDRIRVESGATLALGLGFDPDTPDANTFSDAQASSLVNNLIGNAGAVGFQDGSFLGLKTASNPDQTLSANITGAIGLVVSGFGSVTLNGTNSYTGGTLLQGGEVVASSSSSLGTGPIDFEGGILSFGSGFMGDISSQFNQADGTEYALGVNFNGTVTAASSFTANNTSLTKYGFGALQLSGNNSFTAGVVVDGGKLVLGSANAIGSSGNITFESQTASLVFTANNTNDYAARFKNNTSAISIDTGGQTVTFSGNIDSSNTGGLEYYADGQLVLSGSNSYTGNTTIEGSSTYYSNDTNGLVVTNANSLGHSSGKIFFLGGGTLIYGANFTQDLSSRFSNSDTEGYFINTNGNNVTFASALTFESGALVKKGNGTLTLTGANTYGFGTHVLGGTLAGSTSSLQGGITIGEGAVLQFTQTSAGNYNGTLAGNGTLVKNGAGSLTLDGISGGYYDGSTIVNSGNLVITVTNDSEMSLTGDILNNATVQFNQTANGTYAGNLSGSGAFVKNGNETLTLNGNNTYSGGTTVNSGTLIGSTSSLQGAITNNGVVNFQQTSNGTYSGAMGGSGSLVKSGWGSTVTLSGNNNYTGGTIIQDGTLAGTATSLQGAIEVENINSAVIFNQVSTGTQSGVITGNGSFIKAGSGALTLVGNNTYSGSTSVREGTLSFGVGASLANTTQSLGTSDDVFLGLAGTSSGTLNYTGNATNGWFAKAITISGNGSDTIRNSGSGALILTGSISAGSNSFILAGGSNGIVVQGAVSGGSASSMTIDGGKTTLQANNSSFNGDVLVVNGGNLTTGQSNALPAKSVSLDATGSGGSRLTVVGNQTVGAIAGASTSQIDISLGTLAIGSGSSNSTFAGAISGNGVLAKINPSTLILTGNASHTGGTVISGGTLQIGNGGATGSLSGNISNSGTLALNRSGNSSLSGNISGTGSLQQNGSGTVTLSGNNTYTGATTINSGILALGANNSVSTGSNMTINGGTFGMGTRNQSLASFTLNDGSVTGNGTLSAGSFSLFNGTISAVIGGNGSVTKNGAGTFTFNGSNTYSGKTAVRDGILAFNTVNASAAAAQSLGTNATIDLGVAGASSATLNYTGGNGTLAKNINALGNGSNTVQNSGAGRLTLSGTLSKDGTVLLLLAGSGGITVSGNITGPSENSDLVLDGGVITLSGNNTYNGPTFLSNGTQLTIASATAVPGALVMDVSGSGSSGVALTTNASIASLEGAATSMVSIGNRTLTIGADTGSSTFNGTISGTGALVKSGNSSLTLNGNQTYTGGTILDGGTLVLGRADNTLATSGNLTVNGTLLLGSNNQTVNRAKLTGGTISGTGLLTASDYALESGEITANLAGTANITKTTSGSVVLSGTNTQNGTIAINGGLLQFAKTASLFNGANASWTKQNITATANGTLGLNIGGAGEFTEDNLLEILQSLTANITNNGLRAGSGIALDTTNAAGGNFTFTGTIADSTGTGGGAISFEKLGSNTLVFSNNQSYTGNTTISGGTLSLVQSESLTNSASLTIRNGTLALSPSNNETIGDVTMNDGAITGEGALLTASSYTFDAGQVFANLGGNATLTKNSNGTVSLYGDNSFTGNTTVNTGTLLFGKTSALYGGNSTLWTKSKLTFNSGGGLGLNVGGEGEFTAANLTTLLGNLTSNVTTSGLKAGSFLALNTENAAGGNFSYTGNITNSTGAGGGALSLVKLGNGTLALSGSNSYTGGTTVEVGKLQLQSYTNNSNITNNSLVEFSNDSGSIDYIGNMTGPGSVLKTGSSTLYIRNNMQHTGGTTVEGGSITIAVIPSLSVKPPASLGGNVHFVNQGLLTFANDSKTTQLIFPGVISGNASLVVSSGITQLTSSSTYTGNTTLTGGKLILANATTLPSGTDLSMSSAVMEMGVNSQTFGNTTIRDSSISGSGIMTVSSILISGSGALEPSIAGNASLTKGNGSTMGLVLKNKYNLGGAANSYTGNTTINGGILVFDRPGSLYGGNQSLWTPENIIVQSGAALSVGAGSGVFDGTQVAYLIDSLSTNITGGGLQAGSNFGLEVNGVFSLDTPFNDSTGLSGGSLGLVKTGAGTLTLNATNLFTGNLSILQGTVVLGNVTNPLLPTKDLKVNGGTFDVGDAQQTFNTVTLQTGTVAGNAGNITATNGYFVNSGLITANLKGNTYLEKDTQGAIVSLNGTNTYTGTTTVKSGTLELNKAQALYGRDSSRWNSGNISVNSGGSLTFKVGSSETFSESEISTIITGLISNRTSTSGGFKGGSFFVIDTSEADNGNFTVTESITDPSSSIGSLNVTKLGSGTLTLNASNSFSGTMLLNSGTLVLGHATDTLSDNASVSMSPSTSLLMGGNSDTIKSLSASSGAYVFGTGTLSAGNSFSFTSANVSINLSGSAALSAVGSTTLWGNNTYTGNTTVSQGTLSLQNVNALSGSTLVHANPGSSVQFSVPGNNTYNFGGLAGNQTLELVGNSLSIGANNMNTTYNATLSGTGSVIKIGNGTLTFLGDNTYTGGTTISSGTLALGNGTTSGSVTGNITNNAALVFNRSNNATYSATISGNGSVAKNGSATLTLSGNNTYTGNTTINSGTISLTGSLANSAVSIASGAGLNTSGGLSENSTVVNSGNFTVNAAETIGSLSGSGNTILNGNLTTGALSTLEEISGIISGNGTIRFDNPNPGNPYTKLTANNTYTGSTTVANRILILSGNGSIASSSAVTLGANAILHIYLVTASDSTVNNLSSLDSTAFIELGTKTLINIATDNRTFSGTIGSANPGGFTKRGNGTLTLAGINDYYGATSIEAGVLFVTGSLFGTSTPTAVSVSSGATYQLGSNDTVASIAGAGSINLGNNTLTLGVNSTTASTTFSGVVSGADGSLIKAGTGTLTLSGNNTYTGGTTISAGTLAVSSGGSISHTSNNTVIGANSGDNATLTINGGSVTNALGTIGQDAGSTGVVNLSSGNWTNTELRIGNSGNGTLNLTGGTVSNSGNYTIIGYGNSSTGVANVSGGNWTNGDELRVGLNGNGTLNITGGNINNQRGYLASENGSTGVVNVSGGNWTNTDRLRLGRYGNGTLNLTGGNVIIGSGGTGNLTVAVQSNSTGTLNIGNGSTVGNLQAARVTAGNGTAIVNFNHSGNHAFSPIMEGNLTVNKLGAGTTTLSGNNTYTGGTFITSGTLEGNTQSLQGAISNNASVVFNQTTNGTYSGAMSGDGALSKIGNGTLTMSGNSSAFSGTAAINAGTVALTGSLANAAMAINNGATLTGNGTAGAVTINSGGTIAPGNSPGTITTGNMTWNGGGIYNWQLGNATGTAGTDWDLISSTTGSLTIGANATNRFTIAASTTNASGFDPRVKSTSWKIADFAGGIVGFSADAFTINATGFEGLPDIYGFGVSSNGTALNFLYGTVATWIQGTGNWTDTSNWEGGFAAVNGIAVEYAGTNGTSTNDSSTNSIESLTFTNNATGAFTLAGGALTLGSGGLVNDSSYTNTIAMNLTLGANQAFAANTANLVVSGNITGSASLTKAGNETLTLSGSNTYTGETIIDAGTLAIASGGSLTGTSKILVGNFTSGNTMSVLGNVTTGNLTLSEHGGSDDNTLTVGGGSSSASLNVGNLLNVGFGGTGNTLDILGNGTVTAGSTEIGGYGANNTLNLTGGVLNGAGYLVVGYFADDNALNITAGGNATVGSVTVGLNATSSNNTILVSGTGSALHTAGLIYLGENGTSNSIVVENGGKVISQNADAVIGFNAGSNGNALSINVTGSQFTNNGTLYVGKGGSENTLAIDNGASLLTRNTRIGGGATSSNNTATVSGNGSVWINAGTLSVGYNGTGNTLTLSNRGVVNITGDTYLGYGVSSASNLLTINGAGSSFASGNLLVGQYGSSNTLRVENGGNVTLAGALAVGYHAASSNNTVEVSGASSTLSAQNIQIGSGANNKLVVSDSGTLFATNIFFNGANATLQIGNGGAAGNLSLTGSIRSFPTDAIIGESHTENDLEYTGPIPSLGNANGHAVIFNHTDSNYTFGSTIEGDLSVSQIGTGTTILTANNTYTGGTAISSGTLSIGNGGASGAITGNITNNAALVFNRSDASSYSGAISGTGILEKLGAGTLTLTGNNSYTGGTTVAFGTLAVSSGSSISHAAADTVIGANSGDNGTLVIDGGTVSNNNGFIGKYAGSVGVVTMNSGAWTNQSNLSVGQSGNGTLNLNGGNLSSAGGDIGSTGGQVNVSGGSWTNSADLYVGNGGSGSLTISGGDVSNAAANVGFSPGGNGSVSISNGTWTNSDMLTIGGFGSGDLVITGGNVSNTLARLGFRSGGSGSARISGGTWSNSSGLMIGIGGDGDLTLTGGTVIANGGAGNMTLALGPSSTGTLNIGNGTTAGTLQAARVTGGSGTAIVNFNHNGSHAFSSILEGNLTVNLLGTGTTTLSGNNTYAGGTFVNAGTLEGDSQSLQGAISNNASVVFNQTANGTYAGMMSGNGTLSKIGSGSLTLSGNNTFTGGTTVDAGTLVASGIVGNVTNSANFVVETGGTAGAVTNFFGATGSNNGTVASLSNLGSFTSSGNITGDVMSFNGLVTIGQSGRVSGNTTIAGGELVVAGAVSNVSNNAILRVQTGGTAGAITNLGNGLATNNGTVASLLTSGIFTNTGNITGGVTSFGTLESSGAIGGSLVVGGGVTTINGTVAGATTVTAGILAGTGTLGDVVINSGGAIAPGNSPGTITTGNMTWNGGGIYNWELGNTTGTAGTDWDLISSTGSLTINATSGEKFVINATNDSGSGFDSQATSYKWQMANFSGNITGFSTDKFAINTTGFNGTSGLGAFSVSANSTALSLNYRTLFVWDAGNGTWSTDTNWLDNALPVNDAPIEFAGLGGTSNNNYLASISGLTFTANAGEAYTLAGGNLSIGAGGIVNNSSYSQTVGMDINLGANQIFDANTADLVVSGNISGGMSSSLEWFTLTKEGNQTLVLAGNNTYAGITTVNAGTLLVEGTVRDVTNNATFTVQQSGVAGSVSNLANATGTNNGTVASLANAGNFTNSGNITGEVTTNGTLTSNGLIGGTLGVDGGSATIGAGGQVVGTSTITSGTLNVSGTVADVTNNATLTIQQGGVAGSVSNLGDATGTNNGTMASLANAGTFTNIGNITGNATTSGTLSSTGLIGGTLGVDDGSATIGAGGQVVGSSTITSGTLDVSGSVAGVTNNATLTIQQSGAAGSVNNLAPATGTNNGTAASLANAGNFTNSGNITGNATTSGTLSSTGRIGGTLGVDGGTATIGAGGQVAGTSTVNAGVLDVIGTVAGVTNNATLTIQQSGVAGSVTNLVGATGTNNGTAASLANAGTFTNSGNITGNAATSGTLSSNGTIGGTLGVDGGTATIGAGGQVAGTSTITSGTMEVSGSVAGVTNNATLIIQQSGAAGSVNNLVGATATNNGTVASLANAGTFTNSGNITGSTTTSGTLTSSGSIGGALAVNAGTATISGSVAGATTISGGILQGTGTLGELTINSGGTISPGNSPGTITVGNTTWNGGGIYDWQTNVINIGSNGTAGTNWDLISSLGALSLNATSDNPITLTMTTLGNATLVDVKRASWEVASYDQGISGFARSAFAFDYAAMTGNDGRYFMSLGAGNTTLVLNYKSAATWITGSGNWTTESQWEDEAVPENGDEVEFAGPGGTSTNNYASGNLSFISGFSFLEGAGAYTVNGNTLQITEDGIINASSNLQTIGMDLTAGDDLVVNALNGDIAIMGIVSGNSSLTKTGNNTLNLTGNNAYNGGTTVSDGTLAGTTAGLQGAILNNAVVKFDQAVNGTYAGSMSGTGSLVKTGSGVVTLSGNNSFTGGTTINSGVLAAAAVSANNVVTLNPNAFGTGSVNINSGGAMLVPSTTLGGSRLALGGDLTLNNGTIAYYDIGESPRGQDLRIDVDGNFTNAGNGVVFDFSQVEALNSGNYTLVSYNGTNFATSAISSRAGVGTTLQGSFDFSEDGKSLIYKVVGAQSSGTDIQNNGGPNTPIVANYNVSGPTITIGTNNTVAALTFNSGGSLNIQQNGVLNVSQGTLNVQSGTSLVGGGTLVAPAGLNKDGTGELDFTNNVVVTGTAAVNAGLLSVNGQLSATGGVVVNPSATLGGAGIVFANVDVKGGNLSPGNSPGTLTVVGNLVLTGANSTIIEIESPTNYDRIVVSGEAALGGTLNAVAYGGGSITPGARYEFLQAGSITGEFDSLIAPEGLRVRFLNSGTIGTLLFGPGSYVPMALNPNQTSVAKALDSFITATEGDELAVSIALDALTTEQFPSAFDQIMPGFYESLADITIEQTYNQAQLLTQRMGSLRLGAQGFQAMGISQPIKYDKDGTSAADAKTASPIVESAMATNWNSWVMANGEFSISRGLAGVPNYNNNAGGFLVGADYRMSENFAAGLFAGYEYSYAKYDGGSSTAGNSALFGLYGSYTHEDGYYADAIVSGGYTGFQTRRSIEFSTIDRTARANPNSGQFSAALNLGKDFEIGKFTLGPIIGAQYTYAGIGGFTETGADSLDLALGQQNANSLRSNLGARFAYNWEVGSNITLIPEVRAFWMHEFLNNSRNISSALDGGNGASFDYETEASYRNSVFGGVGVSAKVGDRWNASVFYNVNFGSENYTNNIISTSLGFSF
jgi:autotransporter-associated beta strand protein